MSLPILTGPGPTDILWNLLGRTVVDIVTQPSKERTVEVRLPPGTDEDVVVHVEVRSRNPKR